MDRVIHATSAAMKTLPIAAALAVAVLLSGQRDAEAVSAAGIQRCEGPSGEVIYTDKPCTQFGAQPAAMSDDLHIRLAQSEPAVASLSGDTALAAMPTVATPAAAARRSTAAGCARSPTQLAMDVQGSVLLHDVNRLAESYHWVGMSHQAALPVMRQLEALVRSRSASAQVHATPTMGLQFADASGEPVDMAAGTLVLTAATDEGMRTVQMNVEEYAGCYFVKF